MFIGMSKFQRTLVFSFSSYSLIEGSSSKKQRGEETNAFVIVAAGCAYVTNAPAIVP